MVPVVLSGGNYPGPSDNPWRASAVGIAVCFYSRKSHPVVGQEQDNCVVNLLVTVRRSEIIIVLI